MISLHFQSPPASIIPCRAILLKGRVCKKRDIHREMVYTASEPATERNDSGMNVLTAALLGLIQGLAEFLPISSSGHLNLLQALFGVDVEHQLLFNILLHVGTLVAVAIVFWKDWVAMIAHPIKNHTLVLLFIASLPALAGKILFDKPLRLCGDAQQPLGRVLPHHGPPAGADPVALPAKRAARRGKAPRGRGRGAGHGLPAGRGHAAGRQPRGAPSSAAWPPGWTVRRPPSSAS